MNNKQSRAMGVVDVQAMFDAMGAGIRRERRNSGMTLGKMVALLEPLDQSREIEPGLVHPDSYRGYYSDLAFENGERQTVADLLASVRECIGQTYQGYKGGDFTMDEDAPVWVASWGHCGERLVGFDTSSDPIRPLTERHDP